MTKPICYKHYDMKDECQWCDWGSSCYDETYTPKCFGTYSEHYAIDNKNKLKKCKQCEYQISCSD